MPPKAPPAANANGNHQSRLVPTPDVLDGTGDRESRRPNNGTPPHNTSQVIPPRPPQPRTGTHPKGPQLAAVAAGPSISRARSPIFWQAQEDTYLYAGPLGEPVGDVEEGTVIQEEQRLQDPFHGWWISTRAADGSAVWVSYNNSQHYPMWEQPEGALWRRVYDSRATPEGHPSQRRRSSSLIVLPSSELGSCRGLSLLTLDDVGVRMVDGGKEPSDAALFCYYWEELRFLHGQSGDDWNYRYQSTMEQALFVEEEGGEDRSLFACRAAFQELVQETVVTLLEDMQKPVCERTTVQHPKYTNVFYARDLLLKLCIDTTCGLRGGDVCARKSASQAFQSMQYVALEAPKHMLSVPLVALAKFQGHVLLVSTVPPISGEGCLYAPLRAFLRPAGDKEIAVPAEIPETVDQLVSDLGLALNLKAHTVEPCTSPGGSGNNIPMWSSPLPVDVEVYAGRDHRLYLLNTSRVLPICIPDQHTLEGMSPLKRLDVNASASSAASSAARSPPAHSRGHGLCPIRAELLLRWPEPVNPDICVEGCFTEDDVKTVSGMCDYIKDTGITAVAGILGFQLPVESPRLADATCNICDSILENELRFAVCHNPNRCCCICSHCYIKWLKVADLHTAKSHDTSAASETDTGGEHKSILAAAVRCGSLPRPIEALVLQPDITTLMHAHGVNMRYLPYVFYRIPPVARFATEHYCIVEMIARAAVHLLQSQLCGAVTPGAALDVFQPFLLSLLQSHGAEVERFWARDFGPAFRKVFPVIRHPLDTSTLSVGMLMERVQDLTGVTLTTDSLHSLFIRSGAEGERPFIQLQHVFPRIKVFATPSLSRGEKDAYRRHLRDGLERMLLFWVGYSPEGSDDSLQPLYLRENALTESLELPGECKS